MATNDSLKKQLAKRNGNGDNNKPVSPVQTIAAYLKKMAPEIEKALPKHMNAERLTRIALTLIRTNPALLECTVPSLMGAVMQAAQLGLEPGLIGHCYFVPFNSKKKDANGNEYWEKEVQFIIGYKGMIDLARRSGNIQSIYAHAVYEKDEFDFELGLHPKLTHKPSIEEDRGAFIGAYAVAHFKDGGYQFEFMPKSEIDKRRDRSPSAKKEYSPWHTDYEEMAKKTVIRHMWKYLPISIEIQQQAAQDETVRRDINAEPESVYDNVVEITPEFDELPENTQPTNKSDEDKPSDKPINAQEVDSLFK